MLPRFPAGLKTAGLTLLAAALCVAPAFGQAGIIFTGTGAVDRSMGGAATAAPVDATGALYWNPATLSGLPSSSIDFGAELLLPHAQVSSSLPAGALGPGVPPVPLSGSNRSDNGVFPLPSMALAYRPDGSIWTFGLGIFPIGGFGVNYPANPLNPILSPQPPNGLGLGSIYAQLAVLQMAPTISVQLTDRLSVGFGPTIDMGSLSADPAVFASPDDADGDGFATYPSGTHGRVAWGGGFQAGLFWKASDHWQFGASFKSPQWFEDYQFNSADELGQPRTLTVHLNMPMISSVGVAYTGFERWLLAADFRYYDYGNTEGFRQSGFDPTGAVQGLGWHSIFAVAVGAQYKLTDTLSARVGYTFNQDPISDTQSSFNVVSPTIVEHAVYCGLSYQVTEALLLSVAYAHGFQNSISGPLLTPLGPVPGSVVANTVSADTFLLGATVRFGGCAEKN
jgi:long-chain fatty acid transport protein